jgi:capsular exopolysaccharide synthesis family protein
MQKQINNDQINLDKLFKTIVNYKWLILLTTLITTLLMVLFLYFSTSIYTSSSILEIKSKNKNNSPDNFLLNSLSGGTNQIDKEIEILKTFLINKQALEKINFQVSFYENENFRKVELYKNSPIEIDNIEIFNSDILNKQFVIIPKDENSFMLRVENSIWDKLLNLLSPQSAVQIDETLLYIYGKEIKNKFFKFTINKKSVINDEIYFTLHGDYRQVYDDIISENLSIHQLNAKAPLVEIVFQDSIPLRGSEYVEELSKSFIQQSITTKNEQNNKILKFIDKQLKNIKGTLNISEERLESYKINNQVVDPSTQAKTYIKKFSDIEIELSENLLQQKLIENLIDFINHNDNLDAIAPSLMELNDQPTVKLISILQTLQFEKEELETEYTSKFPKLIIVKKKINSLRKKIISNIENLRGTIVKKRSLLKNKKTVYENKIKNLPTKEKNLVNIQRDYQVSSNMYNYLLEKKTENELIIVATLSDYKIIDHAHTSSDPIKPKGTLMLIIAPILGLFFGIILAVILKSTNNKIANKEELEVLTNLPLLGIIPLHKNKKVKVEVYTNPNSEFTESYRSLRSHLPSKRPDGRANIILATSTVENEGKTTLIANLAAVCQMAGYKSIILNLDLRKPTLHEYFDLKNEKGMSSYLSGKESIQNIIFSTKYPDLHVITSGPIPSNPSELILSNKFNMLLDILKTRYDYIFIDSAPVGLVSDTIHLMKFTDLNIVIFKENHAEASYVDAIHNILKKSNIKNVGIVLNQSTSKNKSNGYGYGYGYGYDV